MKERMRQVTKNPPRSEAEMKVKAKGEAEVKADAEASMRSIRGTCFWVMETGKRGGVGTGEKRGKEEKGEGTGRR